MREEIEALLNDPMFYGSSVRELAAQLSARYMSGPMPANGNEFHLQLMWHVLHTRLLPQLDALLAKEPAHAQ